MIEVTEIDVSGVNRMMNGLHHALFGTGGKGDLAEVTADETKRLALEIGKPPTPKQRKRLEGSIRRDIGRVFIEAPKIGVDGNPFGRNFIWINAGPNYLQGIKSEMNLTYSAAEQLRGIFYKAKGHLPEEQRTHIGTHGKQSVSVFNRFLVARGIKAKLAKLIFKNVGKRDASFAETAQRLGEAKIPSKSMAHIPTGKNITEPRLSGASPEITFGSTATGVQGLKGKVERAVKVREKKMLFRLQKILSGYAHDNNSGNNIHRHAK